MPTTPPAYRVMISSTAMDLPEHREALMHACLRLSLLPRMMEHLPASDAEAIEASLKLVDEADLYVGVFAFRYGYVPEGHDRSITEMEYDRAVERKIPRICFVMGPDHAVKPADVETGPGAVRIEALKSRVGKERVVAFFESAADLRGLALHALGGARRELDAASAKEAGEPSAVAVARSYHHIASIPAPPEPYVAHAYTLLQTPRSIGRRDESNLLTRWAKGQGEEGAAHLFCLEAVGGLGKSALTWSWFDEIAPQEMKPLAGRLWWSFYESDATFENFVTRALAYVSRRPLEEVEKQSFVDRGNALLAHLDREPYLIVLDGLERILVAYARGDAPYLRDAEVDQADAGLPVASPRHPLRRTTDPRAGAFLRVLLRVRASRILASTRLFPADLEDVAGSALPGAAHVRLPGLSDDDALDLWRAFGARASRERLLPLVERIGRHPLLLQVLAGEVSGFREAPGDFDAWWRANPGFDPFGLALVNVQSHVLAYALRGLPAEERRILEVVAGFRMPVGFGTLKELLLGRETEEGAEAGRAAVPFADLPALDRALSDLEDRGLLGWEPRANRYDLHPIVRGVVWSGLAEQGRRDVHETLRVHFEAVPMVEDWKEVESLGDLAPAIELFHALIGLGRTEEALRIFRDRLTRATLYRLSAARQRVQLLERFFPDGTEQPPCLQRARDRSWVLNGLAQGYQFSGRPGAGAEAYRRAEALHRAESDRASLAVGLYNLSEALRLAGALRAAEGAAREALRICRELGDRFQ